MRHAGLRYSLRDGVARLELRLPKAGNRVGESTAQALCDAAEEIELDDRVALVVIEGRGSSFCLGVDQGGPWERHFDWIGAIGRLTRPVIGVVDGPAVAEGFELALACDLRLASRRAAFVLPQLGEGVLPSNGATQRLPRLIGRMRAMDILLTGRRVGAGEAARIGLVSCAVPRDRLAKVVRDEIALLQQKGPIALRLAKEAVTKGLDLTFEQGVRLEQDLYVLLQTTADRALGIRSFREKTQPRFRGR